MRIHVIIELERVNDIRVDHGAWLAIPGSVGIFAFRVEPCMMAFLDDDERERWAIIRAEARARSPNRSDLGLKDFYKLALGDPVAIKDDSGGFFLAAGKSVKKSRNISAREGESGTASSQ